MRLFCRMSYLLSYKSALCSETCYCSLLKRRKNVKLNPEECYGDGSMCVRVCNCAEVTLLNPKSPLIRGLTEKTACHLLYTESLSFKLRDVCCK